MKKIPILLLTLTVALGNLLFFSPDSLAIYQDDDNTWWSVEELLEFSQLVEREEAELCGDDFGCREELFYSRFESEDARYQALNILQEGRFWVTAVNPTEGTLEVLYFDEDQMLKRWGIEEIQPLDFIFIAWFDHINGQIGNYDYNLPIEPQFSDDLHLIYANSAEFFSEEGFPANALFELPINHTNLSENHLGRLYTAVFGENYNSKGYLDYSSCLSDEDYEEGTTCQLMFSSGRGYSYLPSREEPIEDEPGNALYTTEFIMEENEEIAENTIEDEIAENQTNEGIIKTETLAKAPNTGSLTTNCEKIVEFPWWLGLLLITGDITVMWFFWPKKSTKPLDKKREVR